MYLSMSIVCVCMYVSVCMCSCLPVVFKLLFNCFLWILCQKAQDENLFFLVAKCMFMYKKHSHTYIYVHIQYNADCHTRRHLMRINGALKAIFQFLNAFQSYISTKCSCACSYFKLRYVKEFKGTSKCSARGQQIFKIIAKETKNKFTPKFQ